jgi:hypothetical protein
VLVAATGEEVPHGEVGGMVWGWSRGLEKGVVARRPGSDATHEWRWMTVRLGLAVAEMVKCGGSDALIALPRPLPTSPPLVASPTGVSARREGRLDLLYT